MARRRYVPKERGIPMDDPDVKAYVNFLKLVDTRRSSINHWLISLATGDSPAESAVEHFDFRCRTHNFGKWASRIADCDSQSVPGYVLDTIRACYRDASSEDKFRGLHQILTGEYPGTQDRCGSFDETDSDAIESLLDFAFAHEGAGFEHAQFDRVVKSLQLVGADTVAETLTLWPGLSVVDGLVSSEVRAGRTRQIPADRKFNSMIGGIALRAEDCKNLNSLLAESQSVGLTADAAYLASELTMFPIWRAFLENPIRIPHEGSRLVISGIRVASGQNSLAISYTSTSSDSHDSSQILIPVSGVRSYRPDTRDHATVIILNYLFADTECLETTYANRDASLVDRSISDTGERISTIYRPTGRGSIRVGIRRFIIDRTIPSARKKHAVRGHFRTVDGRSYPVKPHRREG